MRGAVLGAALVATLALGACGFRPLYGSGTVLQASTVQAQLNTVAIDTIPDRTGIFLRNDLLDLFYKQAEPVDPVYRLTVSKVTESKENLDITVDEEATRAQLRQSISATLVRIRDGKVVLTRGFYTLSSYNILESQFTTRVSEDNARQNGLTDLARQIERAVVLSLQLPEEDWGPL